MTEPALRSVICKMALATIESDPKLAGAVLDDVDMVHIEAIRSAGRMGWAPAEALIALNRSYLNHAGEAAFLELWRRYTVASVKMPLFGPVFQGAVRLFGLHPGAIIRFLGKVWAMSTTHMGQTSVIVGERGASVQMSGIPRLCREPVVGLCMHAVLLAILDLTEHLGRVDGDVAELEEHGRYDLRVTW